MITVKLLILGAFESFVFGVMGILILCAGYLLLKRLLSSEMVIEAEDPNELLEEEMRLREDSLSQIINHLLNFLGVKVLDKIESNQYQPDINMMIVSFRYADIFLEVIANWGIGKYTITLENTNSGVRLKKVFRMEKTYAICSKSLNKFLTKWTKIGFSVDFVKEILSDVISVAEILKDVECSAQKKDNVLYTAILDICKLVNNKRANVAELSKVYSTLLSYICLTNKRQNMLAWMEDEGESEDEEAQTDESGQEE